MAIHTIHCIRCTLQQSCAQINLAWLELTFHLKKVWDHDIFRFCWPFQLELLPPQWMLDVFLWLFSHGPGFNHCNAFGNKKQCQYFLMMNNKNCMTTIKLKTLKSLILFPENSNLYFSRHNVVYLKSSLWKCSEKFCEWLHVISGIKKNNIFKTELHLKFLTRLSGLS